MRFNQLVNCFSEATPESLIKALTVLSPILTRHEEFTISFLNILAPYLFLSGKSKTPLIVSQEERPLARLVANLLFISYSKKDIKGARSEIKNIIYQLSCLSKRGCQEINKSQVIDLWEKLKKVSGIDSIIRCKRPLRVLLVPLFLPSLDVI